MQRSEAINEIVKAVSLLQGSFKGAGKKGYNSHFKSNYITFDAIWDAIHPHLAEQGLSIFQEVTTRENAVGVLTLIAHISGQWMEFGPLEIPFLRRDAHAIGAAITYGKRYALSAVLGIVEESDDDDGNAALAPAEQKIKLIATHKQIKELEEMLKKHPDPSQRQNMLNFYAESLPDPTSFAGAAEEIVLNLISWLKANGEANQ